MSFFNFPRYYTNEQLEEDISKIKNLEELHCCFCFNCPWLSNNKKLFDENLKKTIRVSTYSKKNL